MGRGYENPQIIKHHVSANYDQIPYQQSINSIPLYILRAYLFLKIGWDNYVRNYEGFSIIENKN